MKTLKWFAICWNDTYNHIALYTCAAHDELCFETENEAFDWLEANGYIERI